MPSIQLEHNSWQLVEGSGSKGCSRWGYIRLVAGHRWGSGGLQCGANSWPGCRTWALWMMLYWKELLTPQRPCWEVLINNGPTGTWECLPHPARIRMEKGSKHWMNENNTWCENLGKPEVKGKRLQSFYLINQEVLLSQIHACKHQVKVQGWNTSSATYQHCKAVRATAGHEHCQPYSHAGSPGLARVCRRSAEYKDQISPHCNTVGKDKEKRFWWFKDMILLCPKCFHCKMTKKGHVVS